MVKVAKQRFSGTYAELQSIHALEGATRLVKPASQTPEFCTAACLWTAAAVSAVHCKQLLQKIQLALLTNKGASADRLMAWACSFAVLRRELLDRATQYVSAADFGAVPIAGIVPHDELLRAEINKCGDALFNFLGGDAELRKVLAFQRADSPRCRLVHRLRILIFSSTIAESKSRKLLGSVVLVGPEGSSSLDALASAVENLLEQPLAADSEALNPFRGLHQIPECLASTCNALFVRFWDRRFGDDQTLLALIADLLEFMVDSQQILFSHLTPRAYHDIRDMLGETSGSQSIAISKSLLRDNLLRLNAAAEKLEFEAAAFSIGRVMGLMRSWRDLHLAFPLLYLGGSGTRSLIGSADALAATFRMRDSLKGKDGRIGEPEIQQSTIASGFEGQVQQELSHITQSRFHDVQFRTGFYKKR